MQVHINKAHDIELQAIEAVDAWRKAARFGNSRPRRVVGDSLATTQSLEKQILRWMQDTFNSTILMRLNLEVLVGMGRDDEAIAAFRTYVSYVKLHALKEKSGAKASHDSEEGCISAFELILEVLKVHYTGEDLVAKLGDLQTDLEDADVIPREDLRALSRAHGVLGQISYTQAREAISNVSYEKWIGVALDNFEKTNPSDATTATNVLHIRALAESSGPVKAFELAKRALSVSPNDVTITNLIALLLSAENELETALAITEQCLSSPDFIKTSRASAIIDIKKTHIALIESIQGPLAALEELPAFTNLVRDLYGPESLGPVPETHPTVNGANGTNGSKNGTNVLVKTGIKGGQALSKLIRSGTEHRSSMSSDSPSAQQNGKTGQRRQTAPTRTKSTLNEWLWISQLYLRANLYTEALEAAERAQLVGGVSTADTHGVLGEIELASGNAAKAWKQFQAALSHDLHHTNSAVGLAQILISPDAATAIGVSESSLTTRIESVIGLLESITTRKRGRLVVEAWYTLGVLYEKVGDEDNAREALWRSVELAETCGVRPF